MNDAQPNANRFLGQWLAHSLVLWPVAVVASVLAWLPLAILMVFLAQGAELHVVLRIINGLALMLIPGAAIGYFVSPIDRRVYVRIGLFTALLSTFPIIVDRFMREFSGYMNSNAVGGRPVPTLGQGNQRGEDADLPALDADLLSHHRYRASRDLGAGRFQR